MPLFRFGLLVLLAAAFSSALSSALPAAEPAKKLIHLGWESPTPTWLAAHLAEVEASAPWSGITVRIDRQGPGGEPLSDATVMHDIPWRRAWLEPDVQALKSIHSATLTDNFVRVNLDPGKAVPWDDDDRWRTIADNMGTVAWFANQVGFVGLLIDPECYQAEQFSGAAVTGDQAAARRLVRQRGRECMTAMGKELPRGRFLVLWLYSLGRTAYARGAPTDGLALDPYGLWPAFCDGLLEALPAEARLIDGCEDGYWPQDPARLATLYGELRQPRSAVNAACLDPALVPRFRAQVDIGFGLWSDLFMNSPERRKTIITAPGEQPVDRFAREVEAALAASDEYVWLYSEQTRWFDSPYYLPFFAPAAAKRPGGGRLMRDFWPQAADRLGWAVDPDARARAALSSHRDPAANLVANPGFEVDPSSPAAAAIPQPPVSPGSQTPAPVAPGWALVAGDPGIAPGSVSLSVALAPGAGRDGSSALRLGGFIDQTIVQSVPCQAGKRYVLEGWCRRAGASAAFLALAWTDARGRLTQTQECSSVAFLPSTLPGDQGWARAVTVVEAPPTSERLLLMLAAGHQRGAGDLAWFDDLGVWPLDLLKEPVTEPAPVPAKEPAK